MLHEKSTLLAAALLMGADRKRYTGLITDLENSYSKGQDDWPKSVNDAYALLCNWRVDRGLITPAIQDVGTTFYQQGGGQDTLLRETTAISALFAE